MNASPNATFKGQTENTCVKVEYAEQNICLLSQQIE